jgi:kinesin family member C1
MDSPLYNPTRTTTTTSSRKRKSLDNSNNTSTSLSKTGTSNQKENGINVPDKRAKCANGSILRKKALTNRNNSTLTPTGVKSRIPKPTAKSSNKKKMSQKPSGIPSSSKTTAAATTKISSSKLNGGSMLGSSKITESITDLGQDTLAVVEEFRKQVNKFPNIPKGSKYDHKKRADAFKSAWMDLRKSAGANCIRPVKKFIEEAARIEMKMNNQDHEVRVECEKLAASARSLEQEVNTLNLKIQVLSKENANFMEEKKDTRAVREQLNEKMNELENQLEAFKNKLVNMEQEDAVCKEKIVNLSKQLETKREECTLMEEKFNAKANDAQEEALQQQNNLRKEFETERTSLNEKIVALQSEIATKTTEFENSKTNYAVLEAKETHAREEIVKLTVQINEQKESLHKHEINAAKTSSEIDHLRERLSDKDSQSDRMTDGLKQTLQMSEKRCEEFRLEKLELSEKLTKVNEERRELEQKLSKSEADLIKMTRDYEDAVSNIAILKEEKSTLETNVSDMNERNQTLNEEKAILTDKLTTSEGTRATQEFQIKSFETELNVLRTEKVKSEKQHQEEFNELNQKYNVVNKELMETKTSLTLISDKKDSLDTQLAAFTANQGASQQEQMEKICKLSVENETLKKQLGTASEHAVQLLEAEKKIKELEDKIYSREAERRKLHNLVQELRGNVRVAVRVRPLLGNEPNEEKDEFGAVKCDKHASFVTLQRSDPKKGNAAFNFDKVFDDTTTNKDVFDDVSDLIQSALDGYQVCIFSYGQTGSGKTHTMQGSLDNEEMRGIIPRAVEQILQTSEKMKNDGWNYTIKTSFLEIYNESVNDLFAASSTRDSSQKYTIRHTKSGVQIDGLNEELLSNYDQLEGLLARAQRNKSIAATSMNKNSSRSHCCFTLKLVGQNEKRGTEVIGSLNLVDLAGSERLDRSKVTGDRLKETLAINKSLSSLVDVFDALAKKSKHVPFRNSKLTFMLQGCLSGNGKTMMIVNVSPTTKSANETMCSLRFAKSVNQTELGRAKKNVSGHGSSNRPSTAPESSSSRMSNNRQNQSRTRPANARSNLHQNTKRQRK